MLRWAMKCIGMFAEALLWLQPLNLLHSMLESIDNGSKRVGNTLSSIASSNDLLLKHDNSAILKGGSWNETVQLCKAVQNAVGFLSLCRRVYGDDWLTARGLEAGLLIDKTFIANYEHLLLRLEADLMEALARKTLEKLLRNGHDKTQRELGNWFTEFAEKPRPLSISFPWTVKPSLAVLWGVCWMFYPYGADEQEARNGNDRVQQDIVLRLIDANWNPPASDDCKLRDGRRSWRC